MTRKKIRKEVDWIKDELLETTKDVIDKMFPLVTDGFNRIITGFTKSVEESLRTNLKEKIEKKKSNKKKGEIAR